MDKVSPARRRSVSQETQRQLKSTPNLRLSTVILEKSLSGYYGALRRRESTSGGSVREKIKTLSDERTQSSVKERWNRVRVATKVVSATTHMGFRRRKAQMDAALKQRENSEQHQKLVSLFNLRKVSFSNGLEKRNNTSSNQYLQVWDPTTAYAQLWIHIMGLIIALQLIYIPFILTYSPQSQFWISLGILFDVFFWADIVFHFNCAFYKHTLDNPLGTLVTDRKEIALRYIQGWFWLDLIAALPLFLSNYRSFKLIKGLRIPRLFGLLRIIRIKKTLRGVTGIRYSSFSNYYRLARLLAAIFAIIHIMSCLFYSIVKDRVFTEDDSLEFRYTHSFYLSLLMMLGEEIGPITVAEQVYCSFAILTGAVIVAVMFGNVAILVSSFYADVTAYNQKMENVCRFMKHLGLPVELQQRIQLFYKYLWQQYHTLDGDTLQFIPELSQNLQTEVHLFLNAKMIHTVPLLQECSPEVVQELVLQLEAKIYMAHDYIVTQGEIGLEMYFVQRGECEVVSTLRRHSSVMVEKQLRTLSVGDYFGELALLVNCRRTVSVRAKTFSTLCVLHRDHYQHIVSRYKADRNVMEKLIMSKLKQGDEIPLERTEIEILSQRIEKLEECLLKESS